MADRPLLFSAPMVRALLEGRKTQTRRVLTPACDDPPACVASGVVTALDENEMPYRWPRTVATGDRLWVREAFITGFNLDDEYASPVGDKKAWYRATDANLTWYDPDTESTLDNPPWRPSIHMPRWASRLTLTVTDVRVERLQDISEADAVAEGCKGFVSRDGEDGLSPREEYRDLWDSINAKRAPWDSNPWVMVLTFSVYRQNIDQMPEGMA